MIKKHQVLTWRIFLLFMLQMSAVFCCVCCYYVFMHACMCTEYLQVSLLCSFFYLLWLASWMRIIFNSKFESLSELFLIPHPFKQITRVLAHVCEKLSIICTITTCSWTCWSNLILSEIIILFSTQGLTHKGKQPFTFKPACLWTAESSVSDRSRTCKLPTERPQPGDLSHGTFLLWDNSASHCITVPPFEPSCVKWSIQSSKCVYSIIFY